MTRVKICGLTREEDVDVVVDAGADAVGFISGFPNSPRNISIARAASLASRVPPFVTSVLVTTGEALAENSDAVKRIGPRAIQLYGSLVSPETVRASFRAYLLRPYSVSRQESDDDDDDVDGAADVLPKAKEAVRGYDALVTDTYRKGYDGGTGLTSDWSVCAAIGKTIAPAPLILSGGLRPENVELAIATAAPFCVDVSSGVESAPGVKDQTKVRAFVTKANAAEERRVAQ
jgi:phosphoribosylanthranilate isomerase